MTLHMQCLPTPMSKAILNAPFEDKQIFSGS